MRRGPRPINRPWTPAEDAQLLALLESKMERPLIARKLKRTVAAITIRLMVLRNRLSSLSTATSDCRCHFSSIDSETDTNERE
jgi:hypothetical protein